MSEKWFETVAIAQRRAEKRLPRSVYGALVAGSEKGLSSKDNLASFDELGFAPHVAGLSNDRTLATTVMGQSLSIPVIISPTGVQAVHPDGEVALARAAVSYTHLLTAQAVQGVAPFDADRFDPHQHVLGRDDRVGHVLVTEHVRRPGFVVDGCFQTLPRSLTLNLVLAVANPAVPWVQRVESATGTRLEWSDEDAGRMATALAASAASP